MGVSGDMGVKSVSQEHDFIHIHNGEVNVSTIPHCDTDNMDDKYGIPCERHFSFALDSQRTLVVCVSESVYSEMRGVAAIHRGRLYLESMKRKQDLRRIFQQPKRKKRLAGLFNRRGGRARVEFTRVPSEDDIRSRLTKLIDKYKERDDV